MNISSINNSQNNRQVGFQGFIIKPSSNEFLIETLEKIQYSPNNEKTLQQIEQISNALGGDIYLSDHTPGKINEKRGLSYYFESWMEEQLKGKFIKSTNTDDLYNTSSPEEILSRGLDFAINLITAAHIRLSNGVHREEMELKSNLAALKHSQKLSELQGIKIV